MIFPMLILYKTCLLVRVSVATSGSSLFAGHSLNLRLATPLSMEDFRLCLSREHTGFRFQKSPAKAAELVSEIFRFSNYVILSQGDTPFGRKVFVGHHFIRK